MDVSTLYVGQGALAVIRHAGEAIVVDSLFPATSEDSERSIDATLDRLLEGYVLQGLILTSFDDDHCCVIGIDHMLSTHKPDWVMYPKYYKETQCASETFKLIIKHEKQRESSQRPLRRISVRLDKIDSRLLDDLSERYEFELFSPHIEDMDNSNNSGIVVKVSGIGGSGFSYLVTGDTEGGRWESINKLFGKSLRSDVMAAPHHGSKNGAHAQTVLLVEPNTVLISAGVENQYGHPDPQAVGVYQRVARHVHSTNVSDGVSLFTRRQGADFLTDLFR